VLRAYVGVLAAVILVIATNAGMIGVSRLTFSMGQHRQLPERLRQVHPRFRTPHVAIITFSIIASIAILPGQADLLATMYSFGAMLSFTIAHASILWMRRRLPDAERGWKPPGEVRIAGVGVPLTAVFGGLGTFGAWIVVMVMNPVTMAIGLGWMILGSIVYLLYRRHHDLPVKATVTVVMPEPLDVEEVEYQSVLVPFEDDPFSELTIGTAARLAARKSRGIHIVSLLNVPAHLPLDAPLPRQQEKAQSKIEQAKLIGGRRVTGHVVRVRPGQAPKAIIDEAVEIKAVAIVMQLTYRNGTPLYGKTLQGVLGNRPCRVIVAADPGGDRSERPLAAAV
jgi:APA family basic amino acid/polyamine antiporter